MEQHSDNGHDTKVETTLSGENKPNGVLGLQATEYVLPASILLSALIISGAWIYTTRLDFQKANLGVVDNDSEISEELQNAVLPGEGIVLPVRWGDIGLKLVETGVIDAEKLSSLYEQRGGMNKEDAMLLSGAYGGELRMDIDNAGFLLNLFWALGLGTKNDILDNGPMQDPQYGGAGNFASTGGWSLARGDAMDHYSRHSFITMTPEQQALVERVSKGIYRPCCGNSVYFPDCNHGMAMLGLLELMASQGISENEMRQVALQVNSYWFPDTYLTIAKYFEKRGVQWSDINPEEILGSTYSSAQGYSQIRQEVAPPQSRGGGGGCGV